MVEVEEASCIAGSGIRGDRFYNYKENYKGQITFFSEEVFWALCRELDAWDKPPSVFRRNVLVRGDALNALIGQAFQIQGIEFFGVEECKPCHWMNEAFCPGAEQAMKGRGGLRARVLTSGVLRIAKPAKSVEDLFRECRLPQFAAV